MSPIRTWTLICVMLLGCSERPAPGPTPTPTPVAHQPDPEADQRTRDRIAATLDAMERIKHTLHSGPLPGETIDAWGQSIVALWTPCGNIRPAGLVTFTDDRKPINRVILLSFGADRVPGTDDDISAERCIE